MEKKIIRMGNLTTVIVGGETFQNSLTDEEFKKLVDADTIEEVSAIMSPEYKEKLSEIKEVKDLFSRVEKSNILTHKCDSIYWEDVSGLSVPKELVEAVLNAEEENDDIKLETYRNFWTLMSLNTDSECRNNLFWFLSNHNLVIERCGFFVAYRNVCSTKNPDVFTDERTHTFKIRIGELVTMPREECDSDSNKLCACGLHAAGSSWLKKDYFGNIGIVVLINPAEVTAVPFDSSYGKLRTCAYLPIAFTKYDDKGNVIPYDAKDGFQSDYVPKVIYEGLMGTEEDSNYKLVIPDVPNINKNNITNKLLDMARECIANKQV